MAVAVDRKHVAVEGVEKNAPSDLWTHTWKGAQQRLCLLITHVAQRRQCHAAEVRPQLLHLSPQPLQLHTSHATRFKHTEDLRSRHVNNSPPRAANKSPERQVCRPIRCLSCAHRQLDENELVKRITPVPQRCTSQRDVAELIPQPSVDLREYIRARARYVTGPRWVYAEAGRER